MSKPISRRDFIRLLGLSGAAISLARCTGPNPSVSTSLPPTAVSTASKTVRTIRMLASIPQGKFEYPSPYGFRTGPGFARNMYLFDTLTWRDSTAIPIPWLASEWINTPDGLEWTFKLRPNTTFQDGTPLTAEEVVFSYEYTSQNPANWYIYSTLAQVMKSIKAIDAQTVQITLKNPIATFIIGLASWVPIFPKHVWSSVTDPVKFREPSAYIGSGAYRLDSMNEADGSMLFVANDKFFLGAPYIQRLEYVPAGDELVALKAGDIDVASPSPVEGVTSKALAPFEDNPKYRIVTAPGEGVVALHFNLGSGEPYSNISFRQAIVYAIDRQELVQRVLDGNGDPGTAGYLAPSNVYMNKDVEKYPYDQEKAKALLAKAGFKLQDGQFVRSDGTPFALPLLHSSGLSRTAELISAQLRKIGLKVDLKAVDQGSASQLQGEGKYDISLVSYGGMGSDPDLMRSALSSPEGAKFWWKAWGYNNPEFQKLANEQLSIVDDARRREVVNQMQVIVSQDVPVMHMYYPTRFLIFDPAVFDAWYYTPLWCPFPQNKHSFITGEKTGLKIRGT